MLLFFILSLQGLHQQFFSVSDFASLGVFITSFLFIFSFFACAVYTLL